MMKFLSWLLVLCLLLAVPAQAGIELQGTFKLEGTYTITLSPEEPPPPDANFTPPGMVLTLANDGYHEGATDSQFQGPVVCEDNASLIFAHLTNNTTAGSTNKSIIITKRDPDGTLSTADIATIPNTAGNAVHTAPFIRILPSGKIIAFYFGTTSNSVLYRISTNACDISAWGSQLTLAVAGSETFQFPFTGTTTAGVTRIIGQASNSHMGYVELNANESTFQNAQASLVLGVGGTQGAVQPHSVAQNGDRTGFVWTSSNSAGCNRNVHYMYTTDGITFRNAANSSTFPRTSGLAGTTVSQGCGNTKLFSSFLVRSGRNDFGPKLVLLSDNTPVILSNDAANIIINKWNGSSFTTVNVAAAATSSHNLFLMPSGKLVIINATTSWNLVAYTSTNAGATWSAGNTIYTKGTEEHNKYIGGVVHDPEGLDERIALQWSSCFNLSSATPTKHCRPRYLDYVP